jgi:hypothetical protein
MAHPIEAISGTSAIANMAATLPLESRFNRETSRPTWWTIPETAIAKPLLDCSFDKLLKGIAGRRNRRQDQHAVAHRPR